MLKLIKKGITMAQARTAVKAAVEVGLEVTLNFLMVYPYETWNDIVQTVRAIKEFHDMPNVKPSYSFIVIYPGTELEQIAKEQRLFPDDFSWNSPYVSDQYYIAGEDPSVPYFVRPDLPFEKVKAYVLAELTDRSKLGRRFIKKLRRIKNAGDFISLVKLSINYFKLTMLKKQRRGRFFNSR